MSTGRTYQQSNPLNTPEAQEAITRIDQLKFDSDFQKRYASDNHTIRTRAMEELVQLHLRAYGDTPVK